MTTTPQNTSDELEQIGDEMTANRERRAALYAELADLTTKETALNERATTLQAEIKRIEREPQGLARLARLTDELTVKLSKADGRSPTVQGVKKHLERLGDENASVADRLSLVVALIRDVGDYHRLDKNIWTLSEGASAIRKRDL